MNLISIIIPVYNMEKYLKRCVDSVLNQTYKNIEVILVDDGSTDTSLEICKNYAKIDNRVKVIHKENGGQSSARNLGLKVASGNYIGFVDSDDFIDSDMYELLYNAIKKSGVSVSCIKAREYYNDGTTKEHTEDSEIKYIYNSEKLLEEMLKRKIGVAVWSKLFKKEIIEGILFEDKKLHEDFLFMFELVKKGIDIQILNRTKYNYYVREDSTSRTIFPKSLIDSVDNSLYALKYVKENHPQLEVAALYFCFYYRMSYLLTIPYEKMNSKNQHYFQVLHFIKKNRFNILKNKYLSVFFKITLLAQSFFPKIVNKLYKKINGR